MISHGLNSSLPPRFFELGYEKFQLLCADLLGQNTRYTRCQVYGCNGQMQRGIDILAINADGSGVEVGQCKCWEGSTTAAKIREASNDFLPHLEHWRREGLKRFILFAACPTEDVKLQDQILAETRRFKDLGVLYECWDAQKLHHELRPHGHVVRTHMQDEHWVRKICGSQVLSDDAATRAGTASIMRRQGLLVLELASERSKELEAVRELAAQGKGEQALEQIVALQVRPSWAEMPEDIRAKALRIQASLTFNVRDDIESARLLLGAAKTVCPSANTRPLEAMLLRNSAGAQAALDLLTPASTVEEWNIRLELLLELGRPDDVLVESNAPPAGAAPTTETAQARALALLLNREVEAARSEIQGALAKKPGRFGLRHTAAMVDYAGTIAPSFAAWGHLTWPVPPDWILVKRDPVSAAARRSAAATFRELAGLVPVRERESLLVWELACLANEPERQEEAQQLARTLLRESPASVPGITWASERGYEFDRAVSIKALRDRINLPAVTREEIETLVALLANSGELSAGEAVLDEARPRFAAWGAMHSWRTHKAQCLCARGEADEARKLIESEPDAEHRRVLETVILRSAIPKTRDTRALAAHLQTAFESTQDAGLLLSCCEAKVMADDWAFIADHAEHLVAAVPTEGVLRLGVQAAFNCHRFEAARGLIDKHGAICAGGRLPADLRRMLAECLRHVGDVPRAISELESLAHEKPEFASLAQLFRLQQAKGDLPASALTARKFLEMPEAPPDFLLQVAPVVRLKDPELAAKLWEKAVGKIGDDPVLKAVAAFQSYQLGTESKAAGLLRELPALVESGKAPIKALNFEQTIELIRAANENAQKFSDQYSQGMIPVHLIPGQLGWVLARILLEATADNSMAENPLLRQPLLIRHGGRATQVPVPIPAQEKRIFLDVTSILLFQGLGLLDLVEQNFETITVSGHLTGALASDLDKLIHHQPGLLTAKRAVLALLDAGQLKPLKLDELSGLHDAGVGELMGKPWCALLEWCRTHEGVLVEHLPLMSNVLPLRPVSLPPEDRKLVCGERELRAAMAAAGLLPSSDSSSPPSVGDAQTPPPGLVVRAGMPVYLEHGIAALLAASNILDRLAAQCQVFIDAAEVLELRRELDCVGKDGRLRVRVEQLLQRLSAGQGTGKYVPHLHPSPGGLQAGRFAATPEELCLLDAIHFGETVGVPVCCDDRFIQAHRRIGKSPIIGITDLLHHFRTQGTIGDEVLFDWWSRLRVVNARYLPPTAAEILHHLRHAPVRDAELEETPALRTLRRSIASMLLDRDRLQAATVNEHGQWQLREMELPLVCYRAVTGALGELWAGEEPLHNITARADWLWNNLFVDLRILRQCFKSPQTAESDLHALGMTIGMLYTHGLQLVGKRAEREGARASFFNWLTSRALTPALQNTPRLSEAVARNFVSSMSVANESIDEARKRHGDHSLEAVALRLLIGKLVTDLPAELLAEMNLSDECLERWGLQAQTSGVEVAGLKFAQAEFWAAVARTVERGGATLVTADGKNRLRFSRGPRPNALRVGKDGNLRLPILDLFHPQMERRRQLLRAHPRWFDLDAEPREQAIERIVAARLPADRVALLDACRDSSMANFYARLRRRFRQNESLGIDELIPDSVEPLLRFIRHPTSGAAVDSGRPPDPAIRLLANEGLEETICRLSCLPCALPSAVLVEFDALTSGDCDKLLDSLSRRLTGFIQKLHLGRLWIRRSLGSDLHTQQVKILVDSLCDPGKCGGEAKALAAILRWVHQRFSWMEEVRAWSSDARLRAVWIHAAQLQAVFASAEEGPGELAEWFAEHSRGIDADCAGTASPFTRDVCHPRNVDQGGVMLRGLAFLFEDAAEELVLRSGVRDSLALALERQGRKLAGSPSLWRPVVRQPNQLGSFLAWRREDFLPRLLRADAFKQHFDLAAERSLQAALDQLQQRPADAGLWAFVELLCGSDNVGDDERALLLGALSKLCLATGVATNSNLRELVMLTCQYAAALGDEAMKRSFRAQLVELAGLAAKRLTTDPAKHSTQTEWQQLGGVLLAASWSLNAVPDNPAATSAAFFSDAAAILRAWPALAGEFEHSLTHLATQLPVACQTAWIPLQLQIRVLR